MKQKILLLLLLLLPGPGLFSQENIRPLGLQEAIETATSNNDAAKLSSLDEQLAAARYKQSDAIFLPQANFSYTAFTTNNPLNAFGFKLQQKAITAADFNPVLLNHPGATADFTTKFELQQPLVNIDMLYQRKGAAKQVEMYQLISQRTREYIAFETEKAYLQLQMLYAADKVLKEALATAKAMQKTTSNYFDQGLIQKSDVLNADLQVMNMETQIKNTQSGIADASDRLSLLMGKQMGVIYTVEAMRNETKQETDTLQLSNTRADFKALQKGMEGYDMMIKSSKMSYLPRLNAFASYQWNDKAMFGYNANAYLAGVQLSWNIFNGNRTKNSITQQTIEKAKLAKQLDQQKSEAQMQINQAKRQLEDAAFAMKQQELAVAQASEALRVLQNRFTQGLVKTTDVLMAQTQLAQQQLGTVQAVFNYDVAMASLRFLTTNN